jgi:hypothetical protein
VISSQGISRLSRFRVVALLAAVAALAALAIGCGGGDENPGSILSSASLEGIESGNLDLSLHVRSAGKEGGNLDVSLTGPFRRKKDLPQVALKATVKGNAGGEAIDFEGGLTLLSDRAYVNYEGTEYEVDQEYFSLAKPTFLPLKPGQGKKGTVSALNACLEAAAGLDLGSFGNNLSNEGSADVDGTATTKISGDLDVPAALDALVELAENPSCSAQLAAAGRSADELKKLEGELTGSAKKAHVEIYVGDDDIIRKVAGELAAEPKGNGQGQVEADFELSLGEVNEAPKIATPAGAKSILVWLEGFGISPFEAFFLVSEAEGLGRLLELAAADVFPSGGGLAGGG